MKSRSLLVTLTLGLALVLVLLVVSSSDVRFDNFSVVSRDGSQATMVQGSSGGIRAGAAERDRQPADLGW